MITYPTPISEMTLEQAQARLNWHMANPPTLDYIVEFSRATAEIKHLRARIAELS